MRRRTNQRITLLLGTLCTLWSAGCGDKKPPAAPPSNSATVTPASAPAAPGVFEDITSSAGINFTMGHEGRSPLTILETLGGGCALADFDGDGWLDLLLVAPKKLALYKNNRNLTFTDITAQSGLRQDGYWQGCAVGDYNNDGKPDLYLSGYRECALYKGLGAGAFQETTQQAGVASKLWGNSAAFVDVDNDGLLDLFVANYVKFYPNSTKYCLQGGVPSTCGPTNYDPEIGALYRNNGDGTFTDETKQRGMHTAHGNALGVAIADYDDNGWIDLAVANDQLPGDLFQNKGKGVFENVGAASGTAYDVDGRAHAGMGIDWADFDLDGKLELVVTTYQHQPTSFYQQTAPGLFTDACFGVGIGQPTVNFVGFGIKFFDYDNDGYADLIIANGHAVDNIAKTDKTATYRQLPQLFRNLGNGRYEETGAKGGGAAFQKPIVGRGLAVGDIDNDGKPDAVMVDIEGAPLLLHNRNADGNRWLNVRFLSAKGGRDALGAQLTLTANGKTWKQPVANTGSFLAVNDARTHLGLGKATQLDRLEVRWVGGKKQVFTNLAADRFIQIREGSAEVALQPFGGKP